MESARYFEFDNTPEVGRVNTFLCQVKGGVRTLGFFDISIEPEMRIPNFNPMGTFFFVVRVFIVSSYVEPPAYRHGSERTIYIADPSTLEYEPLDLPKRLSTKEIVVVGRSDQFPEYAHLKDEDERNLRKMIYKCLELGINIQDCCREFSEKEFVARQEEAHRKRMVQLRQGGQVSFSEVDGFYHLRFWDFETWNYLEETYPDFDSLSKALDGQVPALSQEDSDAEEEIDEIALSESPSQKEFCGFDLDEQKEAGALIRSGKEFCSRVVPIEVVKSALPVSSNYGLPQTLADEDEYVLYLSDLHLDHKLLKWFPDAATFGEVRSYFDKIVKKLSETIPNNGKGTIILLGDISFNFHFFQEFFLRYRLLIKQPTVFVLGNHEIWSQDTWNECATYNDVVEKYRSFLESVGITLLENDLYNPAFAHSQYLRCHWSREEILEMRDSEIQLIATSSPYVILGGMGFAGLDENYNADDGLYGSAPINRNEEIMRSKDFLELHEKLRQAIPEKTVIVATHMPFSDWNGGIPNPHWVYMSGHTHQNYAEVSKTRRFYCDNQIGYQNESFGFKCIPIKPLLDVFGDYPDGIHEISRDDYAFFSVNQLKRWQTIGRQFAHLYMLKRNGYSMFFVQLKEGGKYCYLNGGRIKNAQGHDLQYFYDRMVNYAQSVETYLSDYFSYQKSIADGIDEIGGYGTIHGCIIDIDSYNHIYVNPLDRSITPYFASSTVRKYVYKNIPSLLRENRQPLYEKMAAKMSKKSGLATILSQDAILDSTTVLVESTEMYRVSRIIKALQLIREKKLVFLWNFDLADKANLQNGKEIVAGFIESKGKPPEEGGLLE